MLARTKCSISCKRKGRGEYKKKKKKIMLARTMGDDAGENERVQ
jgi:hypothetical protein